MPLKAIFAITAALAVAAGFALPGPKKAEAQQVPTIQTLDLKD